MGIKFDRKVTHKFINIDLVGESNMNNCIIEINQWCLCTQIGRLNTMCLVTSCTS